MIVVYVLDYFFILEIYLDILVHGGKGMTEKELLLNS
jgi:hypothetical protein